MHHGRQMPCVPSASVLRRVLRTTTWLLGLSVMAVGNLAFAAFTVNWESSRKYLDSRGYGFGSATSIVTIFTVLASVATNSCLLVGRSVGG